MRRLQELIQAYRDRLHERSLQEVGRRHLVLVEGPSRRSQAALTGRTDTFKRVVFDAEPVAASYQQHLAAAAEPVVQLQPGDYVAVQVEQATGGTLLARPLARTTLQEFVGVHGSAAPLEVFGGSPAEGQGVRWTHPPPCI